MFKIINEDVLLRKKLKRDDGVEFEIENVSALWEGAEIALRLKHVDGGIAVRETMSLMDAAEKCKIRVRIYAGNQANWQWQNLREWLNDKYNKTKKHVDGKPDIGYGPLVMKFVESPVELLTDEIWGWLKLDVLREIASLPWGRFCKELRDKLRDDNKMWNPLGPGPEPDSKTMGISIPKPQLPSFLHELSNAYLEARSVFALLNPRGGVCFKSYLACAFEKHFTDMLSESEQLRKALETVSARHIQVTALVTSDDGAVIDQGQVIGLADDIDKIKGQLIEKRRLLRSMSLVKPRLQLYIARATLRWAFARHLDLDIKNRKNTICQLKKDIDELVKLKKAPRPVLKIEISLKEDPQHAQVIQIPLLFAAYASRASDKKDTYEALISVRFAKVTGRLSLSDVLLNAITPPISDTAWALNQFFKDHRYMTIGGTAMVFANLNAFKQWLPKPTDSELEDKIQLLWETFQGGGPEIGDDSDPKPLIAEWVRGIAGASPQVKR